MQNILVMHSFLANAFKDLIHLLVMLLIILYRSERVSFNMANESDVTVEIERECTVIEQ